MSEAPFKVVCIDDNWVGSEFYEIRQPLPKKDLTYTAISQQEFECGCKQPMYILEGWPKEYQFSVQNFRRLESYPDITRELASKVQTDEVPDVKKILEPATN